ncbi:MAG: aminotransferase class I/II-fold pyridoxal phosphate-dependent enzyme, partial [Clostridia bacterium]
AFAMTGWRLGYVCAPKELIVPILKIHQYCIMCAPTASQYAGVAALEQGFSDNFSVVEDMRAQYDLRRKFLLNFFKEVGMKTFEPRGA